MAVSYEGWQMPWPMKMAAFFCESCQMPFTVATLTLGVRGFVEHRSTNSWTWLFFVFCFFVKNAVSPVVEVLHKSDEYVSVLIKLE